MFCLDIQMYITDSAECSNLITVDIAQYTVSLGECNEQYLIMTPETVTVCIDGI